MNRLADRFEAGKVDHGEKGVALEDVAQLVAVQQVDVLERDGMARNLAHAVDAF